MRAAVATFLVALAVAGIVVASIGASAATSAHLGTCTTADGARHVCRISN